MKEFIKTLFAMAVVLGLAVSALLFLRRCNARTYITVEED